LTQRRCRQAGDETRHQEKEKNQEKSNTDDAVVSHEEICQDRSNIIKGRTPISRSPAQGQGWDEPLSLRLQDLARRAYPCCRGRTVVWIVVDAEWYGPVAWLRAMYLASLAAAEQMALEMGDTDFAGRCSRIRSAGVTVFVGTPFNGEYFMNKPHPSRRGTINSGTGCEIDQVLGQSWAFQIGLGRILPEGETVAALQSLWRYNFTSDVGHYLPAGSRTRAHRRDRIICGIRRNISRSFCFHNRQSTRIIWKFRIIRMPNFPTPNS
jgi:hypothetical protein